MKKGTWGLYVSVTSYMKRFLGMNARKVNVWHIPRWERDSQAIRNRMAKWMHGWRKFLHRCSQTDVWMRKIFARMQSNGYMTDKNFWTDAVERMKCWWKVLNGWGRTDKWLKRVFLNGWLAEEIFIFERMRSISQTIKVNYNIILITFLEQAPLQLYKNEWP